jgi:hypothetical protein
MMKDIEHCFGAIKKHFTILVSPDTLADAYRIDQGFISCCILHNRLLDCNGGNNWRHRMVTVPQRGYKEDAEATVIPNDDSFLG